MSLAATPDSTIIVERQEPSSPAGVAGYYGTFPIDQQPRIEELVRERWGRGRYLFQIRNADGKTVSHWSRTLAGGPSMDSEGNPISGAITVSQDQMTMSAGPLAARGDISPLNSDAWLNLLHGRDREIRDLRAHIDKQREYYERLMNELRERIEKEKEARIKAENERDRERDRATFEGLRAQVDAMRTGQTSQTDPLDMVSKIMGMMPKPRDTGIGELRDLIALSQELGGNKDADGEWSQIARAFGEFFRARNEPDQPDEPPSNKEPALPGPVASLALKKLLETGLDSLPEVESWARAALPTLTASGRASLAKITKLAELLGWAERIPGIALPALVNAIKSDANRQKWFFEAIDAVKKELG